jgi:hypothetical protein
MFVFEKKNKIYIYIYIYIYYFYFNIFLMFLNYFNIIPKKKLKIIIIIFSNHSKKSEKLATTHNSSPGGTGHVNSVKNKSNSAWISTTCCIQSYSQCFFSWSLKLLPIFVLVTKLYYFSSFTSLQVLLTRFRLLLSTSIFMFSPVSYIFKYYYNELKINFSNPPTHKPILATG